MPRKAHPKHIHPATRTFQALRIAVNDELGALAEWLSSLPRLIKRGGRAAAISFHSLEDRMVKQEFARLATGCVCPPQLPVCCCGRSAEWKVLTKGAVQAGEAELEENPRARSARLRAVERLR
jgi:16S rRNA (cytosine1402-N4)-methyltransferase